MSISSQSLAFIQWNQLDHKMILLDHPIHMRQQLAVKYPNCLK
jgi:hypothetical protein